MSSYRLYLCLASTLERQKQHIAIMDLQAMVLHGVAAYCNHIIFVLPNISPCYYLQAQLTYIDEL